MRAYVKAGLAGALALAAALSGWAALGNILAGAPAKAEPVYDYQWSCGEAEAEYVLREYGGRVGVFEPKGRARPMSVTDIEVDTLRGADRAMLESGIAVRDEAELMALLEDLGS